MKKDQYRSVRLHQKTVDRMKPFFREIGKTYSASIDIILDFFERTGYDPRDEKTGTNDFNNLAQTEKKITNKQERLIKILNKFEQQYFAPSNAQLNLLLQEKGIESPQPKPIKPTQETLEKTVSIARYNTLRNDLILQEKELEKAHKNQEDIEEYKRQLRLKDDKINTLKRQMLTNVDSIINKITYEKSMLKGGYYKIKISEQELEQYTTLKDRI